MSTVNIPFNFDKICSFGDRLLVKGHEHGLRNSSAIGFGFVPLFNENGHFNPQCVAASLSFSQLFACLIC